MLKARHFHPTYSPAFEATAVALVLFGSCLSVVGRTFTDDQGRQTEAELAGVVDDEVVLRKGGVAIRWPLGRLSAEDQAYVKEWQSNPPETPDLLVRMWEKKGFSSAGTFGDGKSEMPSLPNIPGVMEVEKKATYFYFDVDVSNPGEVQANHLSLAYQMYIINAAGETVVEAGVMALPAINPDGRGTVSTRAISTTRTKTTSLSLSSNAFGGLATGQNRSRSSERFGGGWVRVYSHDGEVVGEAQDLHPEIERMKPAWVGPTSAVTSSIENLGQFDALVKTVQEQLGKLQELLKSLPPLPADASEGNANPPKPPLPKPKLPAPGKGPGFPPGS